MKILNVFGAVAICLFIAGCGKSTPVPGHGPCVYPDDIASDGSRCGNRASTVQPGGR